MAGCCNRLELEPRRLGAESVKPRHLISDLVISDLVSLDMGVRRYVGFTPMLERTISDFRAGRRGCAASLLCRHINVIKNSFLSSIVNLEYGPLRTLEAL